MASTNKETQLIERLLGELLREDNPKRLQSGITDLFIRINTETGEVSLYSDDDELLESTIIFSWISESRAITSTMREHLREAIGRLESRGYWQSDLFERPFSIELVGDGFDTIEELLFIDDDLIKISEPLLQGYEEDLEKFLGEILVDLK